MQNKIKTLLLVAGMGVLFASCDKDLELKPTDAIDATKAFQTVKDLTDGLYSVYAGNSNGTRLYNGSVLADELKLSDENRGQGQFQFKWQYTASGSPAGLGQYYGVIDQIHRILDAAPGIAGANAAEETLKKRIQSELITLRGIAYYELLINFMPQGYDPNALGVAVVLKSDLLQQPARNTVGEVMTQIEADLGVGRAETLIPSAPTDPLRLSQASIAAYQARAALLKKDWDKALTYSNDAITLSGKTMSRADFAAYWRDENETETLWKYRNGTAPQLNFRDSNGDVFFEPADKLKGLFDKTNDIRYSTYFRSIAGDDTSIVNKYPGSSRGPQINDLKLVRLAEMYLIRAEANAEKDLLPAAATALNAVRAARITGYTNITFASKDVAIQQILTERYKELCFEGFRFFDLKRRNLGIDRNASDSRSAGWQNLAANSYLFALPIPQSEFSGNKNVVQNPGY